MLYLKIFVSLWLKVRLTLNLRTKPDIEDTNQPVADQFSRIRKIIGLSLDKTVISYIGFIHVHVRGGYFRHLKYIQVSLFC